MPNLVNVIILKSLDLEEYRLNIMDWRTRGGQLYVLSAPSAGRREGSHVKAGELGEIVIRL